MADMHPTLVRANIALFTGDYAEVRRLLQDYRAEGGGAAEYASMALWIDAHAQADQEERLHRLESLVVSVPVEDPYAALAQTVLDLERDALPPPQPIVRRWQVVAAVVILLGVLILVYVNNLRSANVAVADVPTEAAPAPTPTLLPDLSRPLTSDLYTVRYEGGILQVTAVEDDSQRILGASGQVLTPVPGARFVAVEVAFECRLAICQSPPEAELALGLGDQSEIAPRTDVRVQNESELSAVALGVTTRGWLVFEAPTIVPIDGLLVFASDGSDGTQTLRVPLD